MIGDQQQTEDLMQVPYNDGNQVNIEEPYYQGTLKWSPQVYRMEGKKMFSIRDHKRLMG